MKIHNPVRTYGIPLVILFCVGVYNVYKPLPENIHYRSAVYPVAGEQLSFFADTTYLGVSGARESQQEIFDELFRMIAAADSYILIDMFFFSDFTGVETSSYRELSKELTDTLIAKKAANPGVTIQVITDPINTMYGGHRAEHFEALRAVGIPVTVTNLGPLRDSNPIYSSVWRTLFQWWGNTDTSGWLPNPLDADSAHLSTRTYLAMLNYKANHRKVVVTDYLENGVQKFSTLIASANPHDGSSAHSNSALRIDGALANDVLQSEAAVATLSGVTLAMPTTMPSAESGSGDLTLQLVTEGAIKDAMLETLGATAAGDTIDIAMFYFADRDIMEALTDADARGVTVRLLLDPNKDAFGREKDGSPNRQVAHELLTESTGNTTVRWCNTHGEQCHSKLLLVHTGDTTTVIHGSANLTRRNLDDYNLEASIVLRGNSDEPIMAEMQSFFESQWNNKNGTEYSVPYETYTTTSWYKGLSYRFKEFTGLSRW